MSEINSYQSLSLQLDEVLTKLEQPDIDIDEAVMLYEQGQKIIKQLNTYLAKAENKIEKIRLKTTN